MDPHKQNPATSNHPDQRPPLNQMLPAKSQNSRNQNRDKKLFLVAAFHDPGSHDPAFRGDGSLTPPGIAVTGVAEDVLAVIGMATGGVTHRFEWVGHDGPDSIARPALVTPVRVLLAVASPWHPERDRIMTGLVQLAPEQLGDGPIDDDLDHLLLELAATRERGPASPGPASTGRDAVSQ